jgi:hypothetical protein
MDQPVYSLPLPDRVRRYRELAKEALERACASPDLELRAQFLAMASDWLVLAEGMEKRLAHAFPANDDGEPDSFLAK